MTSNVFIDSKGIRRVSGYINEKDMTITDFRGNFLGACVFGNCWQNYVPCAYNQPKRFSVYSVIDGQAYHGYGSDSMDLVRLKEIKKVPRLYNSSVRRELKLKG